MRAIASVLVISLAVPVTSVSAQAIMALEPGARVRMQAPQFGSHWQVGTIVTVGADTLVMVPGDRRDQYGASVTVRRDAVTRFQISQGRIRRTARGAGIGLLVGAAVGGALGTAASSGGGDNPCRDAALKCGAIGAGILGVGGLVVGTLVGTLVTGDTWSGDVSLSKPLISLMQQQDGRFALSASISF